jgi:hypothetical protein
MIPEWYFELMALKEKGIQKGFRKGRTIDCKLEDILNHFKEEWQEFLNAYAHKNLGLTLSEIADISNMCDLMFEALWRLKGEFGLLGEKEAKKSNKDAFLPLDDRSY